MNRLRKAKVKKSLQHKAEKMDLVYLENTQTKIWTHKADTCMGQNCTIHNLSNHSMRSFPQHWRSDRAIMERINPFGGGCPDPDDYKCANDSYESVHGCILNPYCGSMMCSPWQIDGTDAAWINQSYAVTNDGRVWSFLKPIGPSNGNGYENDYDNDPKELVQKNNGKGYKTVTLSINGKHETKYVHRLVLNAWKGECEKGFEARHLDGNRSNNNLSNLEWSSRSENNMDKWAHGTMPHGTFHPNSKLTPELVISARELWKQGLTLQQVKDTLNVSVHKGTLHEAIIGNTWRWVN